MKKTIKLNSSKIFFINRMISHPVPDLDDTATDAVDDSDARAQRK